MTRFFSFGCSFTEYKWPTWADILGRQYDKFENWGRCGGGNHFIFNSLVECHARNNITKDDLVIVMWTNVLREDRFVDKWLLPGNIHNQDYYNKEFLDKFVTIKGCYIRDMAFISAVDSILSSIECKYFFLSMVDITNPETYKHTDVSSENANILELYSTAINKIRPSVHKTVFNYDWWSKGLRSDYHPLPEEHLYYLDQTLPEIQLSEDTRKWVRKYQKTWNKEDSLPSRFGCKSTKMSVI